MQTPAFGASEDLLQGSIFVRLLKTEGYLCAHPGMSVCVCVNFFVDLMRD